MRRIGVFFTAEVPYANAFRTYIMKKKLANLLLLLLTIIVGLIPAEIYLRIKYPDGALGSAVKLNQMADFTSGECFIIDPDFGFRPVLGNNIYNEYGTLINRYSIKKSPSVTRLLFIGDSVTMQGKIIEALRRLYGEKTFEYWNAGVGSFNTVQEVGFYNKYNYSIKPDHVILTFHMNDFETTPIVFADVKNKLVAYAPDIPQKFVNRHLFKYSYVYRLFLGTVINMELKQKSIEQIENEVKQSLLSLKETLSKDGIRFTVIFHPYLLPYEKWPSFEKGIRDRTIQMFKTLGIRYFDMTEVLYKAERDNINMIMSSGEYFHPSDEMAQYFAKYLYDNNLLYE